MCGIEESSIYICVKYVSFRSYSKYVVEVFSEEEKRAYRAKYWPDDVGQAYSLAREIAMKE